MAIKCIPPSIPAMVWATMGSVRASRDALPYATRLLTYLLSPESGRKGTFTAWEWLLTLNDEDIESITRKALFVYAKVETDDDLDVRADLVMAAEMLMFEEKMNVRELVVGDDGFIQAIKDLGICSGLELLRRRGWIAVEGISMNLDLVSSMITPVGEAAHRDMTDDAILEAFNWARERSQDMERIRH